MSTRSRNTGGDRIAQGRRTTAVDDPCLPHVMSWPASDVAADPAPTQHRIAVSGQVAVSKQRVHRGWRQRTRLWRAQHRERARFTRGGKAVARGQSLVEFALSISILMLLMLALLDLGVLLMDHLAVTTASRQAALAAASAATHSQADCNALAAIAIATAHHTGLTVTRIVIYEAAANGWELGGAGTTGYADVYTGNPGCVANTTPMPTIANWLPATRHACFYTENSLGVEIDYTFTWQTTVFALPALQITDHAVVPLAADMTVGNC